MVAQSYEIPEVKGGFKYSGSQQNNTRLEVLNQHGDKPKQLQSKKRSNNDVVVEVKQSVPATVRVRNPAAGKNRQVVPKGGGSKPAHNIQRLLRKE